MKEIAYQNKDITAKVMADTLMGKSLAAFGLPELKIVDILPTNLPVIESNELRLDNLFLLSDGSLAIIDYESSFDKENFVKYLNYIARVIKRFAVRKELMELMILPLTVKGSKGKQVLIEKTVALARKLSDRSLQTRALAGILTFTDKVIDPDYARKIKEEMQMTLVGQMLIQEGLEKGLEEGIKIFILDNLSENIPQERILEKLKKNFSLSEEETHAYFDKYSN